MNCRVFELPRLLYWSLIALRHATSESEGIQFSKTSILPSLFIEPPFLLLNILRRLFLISWRFWLFIGKLLRGFLISWRFESPLMLRLIIKLTWVAESSQSRVRLSNSFFFFFHFLVRWWKLVFKNAEVGWKGEVFFRRWGFLFFKYNLGVGRWLFLLQYLASFTFPLHSARCLCFSLFAMQHLLEFRRWLLFNFFHFCRFWLSNHSFQLIRRGTFCLCNRSARRWLERLLNFLLRWLLLCRRLLWL